MPTCGSAAATLPNARCALMTAASAKAQPWSLARALRCQGLVDSEQSFPARFEEALRNHEQTPDAFEAARTRLAYGERLRRTRNRVLARSSCARR